MKDSIAQEMLSYLKLHMWEKKSLTSRLHLDVAKYLSLLK